jgi:hypothetical protein
MMGESRSGTTSAISKPSKQLRFTGGVSNVDIDENNTL